MEIDLENYILAIVLFAAVVAFLYFSFRRAMTDEAK